MRTGEDNRNITDLEKKAGQKAARTLSRRLKLVLGTATTKQTGTMLKLVGASAIMKFDALDHIAVKASGATFKQHYGFEGIKKNGVRMSMKPFDHFNNLFNGTNALETLIDEIGAIRAEEITSKIKF